MSAADLARALSGDPIGHRAKTKRGVTRRAEALGHTLGRYKTRKYSTDFGPGQRVMYYVAWCTQCGYAAFTGHLKASNPALDARCPGSR